MAKLLVMDECDGEENMSEPMSSGDIEDVLSSIRRLVSEDLRPVAKPVEGARPIAAEPAGKLLLTPALRVVAIEDSGAHPATSVAADRSAPKAKNPDAIFAAAQRDDEGDAFDENAAPDLADISPTLPSFTKPAAEMPAAKMPNSAVPDAAILEAVQPEPAVADEDWLPESHDDEVHPGWSQTKTPASDNADAKTAASSKLTRMVSEIGAGVSEAEDDWEPETGDAPVSSLSWQAPEWVEEAELADDDGFVNGFEAELEDSIEKSAADLAEDAAVAEIMARAAAGKSQAKAETVNEAAQPEAAKDDIFAEDESVFDETVLRDLVRDLIREELSGTLGERITRNVRKLVRAEINRALTARDFD